MEIVATKVLRGHPFHQKTDNELRNIIRRAAEGAQAARPADAETEAQYIFQMNDAVTILGARRHYETNWFGSDAQSCVGSRFLTEKRSKSTISGGS
jgi:hypothetical protein